MSCKKENLNNSLPLPADSMPECWSKDERMNALFAEFRNRSVNSQDWDSKYKFWRKLIADWLGSKRRCVFSIGDLNVAFKRNGRTPLCLRTVVEELLRNGEIMSETEFLKDSSVGWTAWAIDTMLRRPAVWSYSKLKNYLIPEVIDADAKFVHLPTLRDLANSLLSTLDEESENALLPLSRLIKNCNEKSGDAAITNRDAKMALLWLRKTGKAAFRGGAIDDRNEFLVKISASGAEKVTEAEEGLYRLSEQEKILVRNIEVLECERSAVTLRAKTALAADMRELAKTCLRKRREIDKSIEKRAAALHNVQTLVARIQDARSNTEILTAYKTGGDILKSFENTGLNEENVTNTMDDVAATVEDLADLQSILSTSIGTSDTDLELESELQELLDTSSEKVEDKEKLSLPELADLPELRAELAALDLQDFPSPPKSTPKTNALSSLRQMDNPT